MTKIYHFSKYIKKEKITFSKNDLNSIIQIYSQKVSNGIWKDYSINFEIIMRNFQYINILMHRLSFQLSKIKKCCFLYIQKKRKLKNHLP